VAAARQGWEIDTKVTVHMEIREVTRRESGLSLADIRTEHQKKCCTSDTPLPRDLPRAISRSCLLCLASHTFSFLFLFNHTASKLYSLWHIGYLLDDFYGLHICSRVHLLLYNPARRPASIEPPRPSGSTPSCFPWPLILPYHSSSISCFLHISFSQSLKLSTLLSLSLLLLPRYEFVDHVDWYHSIDCSRGKVIFFASHTNTYVPDGVPNTYSFT
jgi:hypothetical protein